MKQGGWTSHENASPTKRFSCDADIPGRRPGNVPALFVTLGRVIATATEIEIVVIITVIIIVVLIVLVKTIVLNLILVKRMKVIIVLLAALVIVRARTTIICTELNIDTNHNNNNSCCSATTSATIDTNISNYGNNNGSHNRISTHTRIYKKESVLVVITA